MKIDVFKWEEGDDSVKASWRFSAILSLPWKPLLAAAGSTTYHFDKVGNGPLSTLDKIQYHLGGFLGYHQF